MNKPKQPLSPAQAFNRAAALCARSEQSSGDISGKLVKWGLGTVDARQVVDQLIEQGFIDDGRYALIEFKLGQTEVEIGAQHLCEIERLIKIHNKCHCSSNR